MAEMKEIRIGEDVAALKDNVVRSNILPNTSVELNRDVQIQGNVTIEGAVYARNLIIDSGPAEFLGAVYAHNELHVKNDAEGVVYFHKALATSGSAVALLVKGRGLFGADINAGVVKLKNCFVAGSVFASEIQLENSIVLGGCFASKKIALQNAIVGTFNGPEVSAGGVNHLLYPTAFSVEPLAALPGTELYNIALADLGSLYKGEPEKPNTGKIKLDLDKDSLRSVLVDEADTKTLLHSYSVAGRVLVSDLIDLDNLENHFLINSASLGAQVLKTYTLPKADGSKSKDLNVQNIAAFFFDVLSGKIQIADISGEIPFAELKEKYGN
jgi:hypothetical protein